MCRQTDTNYERLYRLMNSRRKEEHGKLMDSIEVMLSFYTEILQRDKLFSPDTYTWEREMCNRVMVELTNLFDAFIETDVQLSECTMKQGEPEIQVVAVAEETG